MKILFYAIISKLKNIFAIFHLYATGFRCQFFIAELDLSDLFICK